MAGRWSVWPALFLQGLLQFALDPVVEDRRLGVGAQGADHQVMPGAHLQRALAHRQRQVEIDRAEGLLRAGFLDRGAEAAEGGIDAAVELRQQLGQRADRVVQPRMLGQRLAGRGDDLGQGRLAQYPIQQVLAGKTGRAGEQNALGRRVHVCFSPSTPMSVVRGVSICPPRPRRFSFRNASARSACCPAASASARARVPVTRLAVPKLRNLPPSPFDALPLSPVRTLWTDRRCGSAHWPARRGRNR